MSHEAEVLKHVLCGALTHLDAIAAELRKLNIKEKPEDNNPNDFQRARILHLTMIAINDIIHPAHKDLYQYFKGYDEYFNGLVKSFEKAKSDGLAFKGCLCKGCAKEQVDDKIVDKN